MSGKSTMIFKLKGLAIFSVICAHMADLPDTANAANTLCANFVKSIGCLGVPVFLLISGYLFVKSTDRPFLAFWKNKAKTIFCRGFVGQHHLCLCVASARRQWRFSMGQIRNRQ